MKNILYKSFLLIITCTSFPALLFIACSKNEDSNSLIGGSTYTDSLKTNNIALKIVGANNADLSESTNVQRSDFGIVVSRNTAIISSKTTGATHSLPFISNAYADNYRIVIADSITSIKIITLQAFGKDLANSDVTKYFRQFMSYGNKDTLLNVNSPSSLSSFNVLPKAPIDAKIIFKLKEDPNMDIMAARFKVTLYFKKSPSLTDTTKAIDLL